MNIIYILADSAKEFNGWCSQEGVRQAFSLIRNVLEILRIVVPIALIAMTSMDIAKKVINPEEKDGQKKIMTRALAALIVFFLPTFIGLVFRLIDIGKKTSGTYQEAESELSSCWNGG